MIVNALGLIVMYSIIFIFYSCGLYVYFTSCGDLKEQFGFLAVTAPGQEIVLQITLYKTIACHLYTLVLSNPDTKCLLVSFRGAGRRILCSF